MQCRPWTAERVGALRIREQLPQRTIALRRDHALDSRDLDHVDADGDDHVVRLARFPPLAFFFLRPKSRFQSDGLPHRSSLSTGWISIQLSSALRNTLRRTADHALHITNRSLSSDVP